MSERVPPVRGPFLSVWDFVVRAYRPVAAWVGVATAVVHGVILPLLPVLTDRAAIAIDWAGVSTFLGVLWGPVVVARTIEKLKGVTS